MTVTNGESGEQLNDLPPSCKYVFDVLDRVGPLSRQELLDCTTLCEPTLDRALRTLQNDDYLHKTRDSSDLRQVVIHIDD